MKRLEKILASSALAIALAGSGYIIYDAIDEAAKTRVSCSQDFLKKEKSLISDSLKLINLQYRFSEEIIFLGMQTKQYSPGGTTLKVYSDPTEIEIFTEAGGQAFAQLGHNTYANEEFVEMFGQKAYELLKGKDVVSFNTFDFFVKAEKNEHALWNSIYLPNADAVTLYKRAVLHEIGHIIFHKIKTREFVDKMINIDLESKAYEKDGKLHPAHTSYDTYFYVGFPDMNDGSEMGNDMTEHSANEQFADIFALTLMGMIDENVKDKELGQKIKLVKDALQRYKK